jgi:putative ABC transport system permease protein
MNKLDFKISLRQLYRQKLYGITNILGLGVALACALVLGLYAYAQFTVDHHHVNRDRIVRVVGELTANGENRGPNAMTSRSLGPLLVKRFPQIGEFVRFQFTQRSLVKTDTAQAYHADMLLSDPNVFKILSHQVLYGDPETALVGPNKIAIDGSMAHYFFGDINPVGKTMTINGVAYQVSLVFADIGQSSHLRYRALLPMNSALNPTGINIDNASADQLFSIGIYTYLLLNREMTLSYLQILLDQFYDDVMADIGRERNLKIQLWPQHLKNIYFDNGYQREIPGGTGNLDYVLGLLAIAMIILAVACINYGNQATALASQRVSSIGTRRLLGTDGGSIALQFFVEAQVTVWLAFGISIVVIETLQTLSLPLMPLNLAVIDQLIGNPQLLFWTAMVLVGTGLMAGLYPALYLARQPLANLFTNINGNDQSPRFRLRYLLVALQFFVTVGVLSSTVIVNRQMQYVAERSLGFNSNNLLSVNIRGADTISRLPQLKAELLINPLVEAVGESSFIPPGQVSTNLFQVETDSGEVNKALINWTFVGQEFIEVMQIPLLEGKNLSASNDFEQPILVNESLVQQMGWQQALGKRIRYGDAINGRVAGVISDFHFKSLRNAVEPLFVIPYFNFDYTNFTPEQKANVVRPLLIRIDGRQTSKALSYIESVVSRYNSETPFEYWFFADNLGDQYWQDRALLRLISVFSLICVTITLVGLAGLIAFTTEQRTKEIGIRKVLGATLVQLLQLLGSKATALVVIAGTLACLVSFNLVQDWLNNFIYRLPLTWHYYAVTVAIVTVATLMVIAYQCVKIAYRNPVEALRYE